MILPKLWLCSILSQDCFWMLKGLPFFSVTINCSDRKFEFQILESIPYPEISSIHAQVVLIIKVTTTLPSWIKRQEFIKTVLSRGCRVGDEWIVVCFVLWGQSKRNRMKVQQKGLRLDMGRIVRHWFMLPRFTLSLFFCRSWGGWGGSLLSLEQSKQIQRWLRRDSFGHVLLLYVTICMWTGNIWHYHS